MRLGALYICFFFVFFVFFPYSGDSGSQISNLHFPWKKNENKKTKEQTNRDILQQSALQIRVFNCAMNAVWQRHTRADKAFFQLFSGFQ
jgi:hypothetical protein